MEHNHQKLEDKGTIQVIFHQKNPVQKQATFLQKLGKVLKTILVWAFWLFVAFLAYRYFVVYVIPWMEYCNSIGVEQCS